MKKCLLTAAAVVLSAAAFISKPIKADAMAQARTWNVYVTETGYFYGTLEPRLKRIYNAHGMLMVEKKSRLISRFDIDAKLGFTNDDEKVTAEEGSIVAAAFAYDHPALVARVNETSTDIIIDELATNQVLQQAAGVAASAAGKEKSEKVKIYHDYIVNHVEYISNAANKQIAYGALIDKAAVCEGYARAFATICHMGNVECILQYGRSMGMDHAWNLVLLQDDEWYEVDTTWDDNGDDYPPAYDNFLKTYQQMENHYHIHYNESATDFAGYYRGFSTLPVAAGTKYAFSSAAPETATENNETSANNGTENQNNTDSDVENMSVPENTANSTNVPSQNTAANSVVNPTAVSDFYSGEHVANSGEIVTLNETGATIVKGSGNSVPSYVTVCLDRYYEVTEIGDGAYSGNSSLKSITIPKTVKKIGAKAFYNCKNLKKIKFAGKKVNKIGAKAFGNIGKKATISIPKKVYDKYVKLLKKSKPVKGIKYKKK
ncbi:leucine-rich repeat domain-containing protein [Butyrivibrio sp. AD3002]|uniref:leucine-rich repeat domain-containing protein n=1 Tax=Butyrivibrio sp. AD3002 TaxID=1280670 RepID=UPI0003B4E12B|nr:leucine-rich repeat domain-containing protein [Butyrivibrio sp. AD3002]